jgi:nitroreductase
MFNDRSSLSIFYATRRSGKPRDMVAPGPDEAQLQRILEAAIRVPDHGKLAPWRFVVVGPEQRDALAALLHRAYREIRPEPGKQELASIEEFARQAPTLIVALSTPDALSAVPEWEQQLSAGAACMNLLAAAHAEGFVGGWLTGWAAYSDTVRAAFAPEGRIAGFLFIGSPSRELQERPRPEFEAVVSNWAPPA